MVSWLIWGMCAFVALCALMTVIRASDVFITPEWHRAFRELAQQVAGERGIPTGDLTVREEHALRSLLGAHAARAEPDAPGIAPTLAVFFGEPCDDRLLRQLTVARHRFLEQALGEQARWANRVLDLTWLSRVWLVHKLWCELRVRASGAWWVAQRARPYWAGSVATSGAVTFAASFVVVLSWAVVGHPTAGEEATVSFFSEWTVAALVLAVAVPVVAGTCRALTASAPPPTRLTLSAQCLVTITLMAGLLALHTTGAVPRWHAFLWTVWGDEGPPPQATALVLVGVAGVVIVGAVRQARSTAVRLSERVGSLLVGMCMLAFAVLVTQMALGADGAVAFTLSCAGIAVAVGSLMWCSVAATEWFLRWRRLERSGVLVPRGTWRWWYLPGWVIAVALVDPLVELLDRVLAPIAGTPIAHSVAGLMVAWVLALAVAPFLIAVSLARFVRRVNATHRRVQAGWQAAPARPSTPACRGSW